MRGFAIAIGVMVWSASLTALAHPDIDRARAAYRDADFEASLAALAAAEASPRLTRADVIALLELRAQARIALDDRDAMERDVRALASLAPDHSFPSDVRPEITESFARARAGERLLIEASARAGSDGVVIDASVGGDTGDLVRRIRVLARRSGEAWVEGEPGVSLRGRPGQRIEFRAEAVGPGGAVLATAGTSSAPLSANVPLGPGDAADDPSEDANGGAGVFGDWRFWAGVGAVAAIAVVVMLVLTSGGGVEDPIDGNYDPGTLTWR